MTATVGDGPARIASEPPAPESPRLNLPAPSAAAVARSRTQRGDSQEQTPGRLALVAGLETGDGVAVALRAARRGGGGRGRRDPGARAGASSDDSALRRLHHRGSKLRRSPELGSPSSRTGRGRRPPRSP